MEIVKDTIELTEEYVKIGPAVDVIFQNIPGRKLCMRFVPYTSTKPDKDYPRYRVYPETGRSKTDTAPVGIPIWARAAYNKHDKNSIGSTVLVDVYKYKEE